MCVCPESLRDIEELEVELLELPRRHAIAATITIAVVNSHGIEDAVECHEKQPFCVTTVRMPEMIISSYSSEI